MQEKVTCALDAPATDWEDLPDGWEGPLTVRAEASLAEDGSVRVVGRLLGAVVLDCRRCLIPVSIDIDAPFEAWFRNWIVLLEDNEFFQVMQQKERSERILQVKYYTSEKYRHFVRCLYIAEYVREFLPKEKGIIWEQEAYMEKLDANLFQRYRNPR